MQKARTRKLFIVFVIFFIIIAGLSYFHFSFKPEMIKRVLSSMEQPPQGVSIVEAKQEMWDDRLNAIGSFRAVKGIDIAPQIGGIIKRINVKSGQDVDQNTSLIEIDDAVEQADLQSNQALLQNANLSLQRQQELVQRGSTSRASFDSATAQRDQTAAAVERSKALISQKKLVAPFAGRLGLIKIDAGQYVSPGTPIITLQQLDPIFVDFPIPEQQLNRLALGQNVEVAVDAFASVTFKGTIQSIDSRISPDTRNILVRAQIDNKDKNALPGMFANVRVLIGDSHPVITVPRTCVSFSLYGDNVYVVTDGATPDKPTTVERRFVRVGETRGETVQISEGLKVGERVVTGGQLKLRPGARVTIVPDGTPPAPNPRPKE